MQLMHWRMCFGYICQNRIQMLEAENFESIEEEGPTSLIERQLNLLQRETSININ